MSGSGFGETRSLAESIAYLSESNQTSWKLISNKNELRTKNTKKKKFNTKTAKNTEEGKECGWYEEADTIEDDSGWYEGGIRGRP